VTAAKADSAVAVRILLLAALFLLGLTASAVHVRAEGTPFESAPSIVATVACPAHVVSNPIADSAPCERHGPVSSPCGGATCCSGISCHTTAALVAGADLPLVSEIDHYLPATERAHTGSVLRDTFRPPIG
jgi:hypothetical protein